MQENYQPDVDQEEEHEELSHMDKLTGVFAEPASTFEQIRTEGGKVIDWLIPFLLVLILAFGSSYLLRVNPNLKNQMVEKQLDFIEERLQAAIEEGRITKDQAEQIMTMQESRIEEAMDQGLGLRILIGTGVFVAIFFIVSGIFFLGVKFGLKGEGRYAYTLYAYGLTQYIVVVQLLLIIIAAFATETIIPGTSLADWLDVERMTWTSFFLKKVDPFSIWFYSVLAVAYAKLYKGKNYLKYFGLVYGIWIIGGAVVFKISDWIPELKFLFM